MGAVDFAGDAQIWDFRGGEKRLRVYHFGRVARVPVISAVESDLRLWLENRYTCRGSLETRHDQQRMVGNDASAFTNFGNS